MYKFACCNMNAYIKDVSKDLISLKSNIQTDLCTAFSITTTSWYRHTYLLENILKLMILIKNQSIMILLSKTSTVGANGCDGRRPTM